ncbi:SDR family NAD(P)-dependent oxidoreductase, partial [Burkholderiales bacterium]|nr:SDR family NAD(P)-dependent oxidoreductase [Burkholderiales bacterium]
MFRSNVPIHNWSNRRVWIIGASEGIGLSLAKILRKKNTEIIVSARNESRLNEEFLGVAKVLPMDVSNTEQVKSSIEQLVADDMIPDSVFWLPALYRPGTLINLEPKATLERLQTNILSAFNLFPRLVRYWQAHPLENKKYHWTWFSSLAAYRGLPNAS